MVRLLLLQLGAEILLHQLLDGLLAISSVTFRVQGVGFRA
jgi:hypothetical protein